METHCSADTSNDCSSNIAAKEKPFADFLAEISGILTWCWVAGACTTYIMHNWGGTYYLEINPSAPLEDCELIHSHSALLKLIDLCVLMPSRMWINQGRGCGKAHFWSCFRTFMLLITCAIFQLPLYLLSEVKIILYYSWWTLLTGN